MKTDILNRTEFVDRIVDFINTLSDSKRGTCFAIDGKWGSGKTFVLELLEDKIKELQSEETDYDKCFLVHYNCWKYDYYDEPAVAMVSAMLDAIDTEESVLSPEIDGTAKVAWGIVKEEIKNIAGKFVENHIGVNVVDIYDRIREGVEANTVERNAFDATFAFKKTLDEARESLEKIAEQKTVVFVVDELDRCMPAYAIKVLERLHHIFDSIDNVIVIIAVDSNQLSHSVKEIYGQDTNEKEYLKKFINITFKLDSGDLKGDIFEKYNSYFSMFDLEDADKEIIEDVFNNIWADVEIRSQEKAMEKAVVIHKLAAGDCADPAVALYEILSVRYKGILGKSIYWIPAITKAIYPELEKMLSKKTVEYLKSIYESASTGNYMDGSYRSYELVDNIQGRALYYIAECYPSEYKYHLIGVMEYPNALEVSKQFAEMLKIVE